MSESITLQFEILDGGDVAEREEFDRDVVKIGKLAGSHLQLDDDSISRIHAVIEERSDGSYTLIDLGSAEGTYVNDEEITKREIADGDILQFGDRKVRIYLERSGQPADEAGAGTSAASTGVAASTADEATSGRDEAIRDKGGEPDRPRGGRAAEAPSAGASSDASRERGASGRADAGGDQESARTITTEDGRQVEPYTLEGYYDDAGNYIPGYYDEEGEYHLGYGYYDDAGQWQVAYGYYDTDGEWVSTDEPVRSVDEVGGTSTPDRPSDRETYTHAFFNDQEGDTLEIAHLWGDHVLSVRSFERPETVTVGSDEDDDLTVGGETLSSAHGSLPLVTQSGGQHQLVVSEEMTGFVRKGDQDYTLQELVDQGIAQSNPEFPNAYVVPLDRRSRARLEIDNNVFLLHFTNMPASVGGGFVGIDTQPLPYWGLSAAAHILFLLLAMSLPGQAGSLQMDQLSQQDRFVQMMVKPEKKKAKKPDWLGGDEKKAAAHKGEETKAGKEDSKQKNKEMAVKGPPDNTKTKLRKKKNKKVAMKAAKEVFSSNQVASPWGSGDQSVGSDAIHAMGNLQGDSKGSAQGFGGLGLQGAGRGGGGGMSERGLGIGEVGTAGRGGGGRGGGDYGKGAQDLDKKQQQRPEVVPQRPGVQGALDKEIIRKVVRQHRREIKYCYEQQLQQNPELSGQVIVKFTISPSGSVVSAIVQKSTLNNTAVEQCMQGKIRHWQFPQPKGGGLVKVNYPFNFATK